MPQAVQQSVDRQPATGVRVQSVSRAMTLLLLVATKKTDGSGKALAQAAGLAAPTAHHLLSTLVTEGLLAKDEQSRYVLGPKAALISEAVQRDLAPPGYLVGGLRELAETAGETCYVAALRQGDIHILASVEGHRPVHVSVPTSEYRDAHARAAGKVFLAFDDEVRDAYLAAHPLRRLTPRTITSRKKLIADLETTRARGYALDEEEFMEGVCCVSAPVLDENVVLAAYSMSVPTHRWNQDRDELIEAMLATAKSVHSAAARKR